MKKLYFQTFNEQTCQLLNMELVNGRVFSFGGTLIYSTFSELIIDCNHVDDQKKCKFFKKSKHTKECVHFYNTGQIICDNATRYQMDIFERLEKLLLKDKGNLKKLEDLLFKFL